MGDKQGLSFGTWPASVGVWGSINGSISVSNWNPSDFYLVTLRILLTRPLVWSLISRALLFVFYFRLAVRIALQLQFASLARLINIVEEFSCAIAFRWLSAWTLIRVCFDKPRKRFFVCCWLALGHLINSLILSSFTISKKEAAAKFYAWKSYLWARKLRHTKKSK